MNWLIWEKMFIYFYNKFMLVNYMHHVKCAVNSSLLTLFWLLQKFYGTLDPCFIMTHSIHKEDVLQIYFGVIFHGTRHPKQAHITYGAFIHCALFLAVTSTQTAVHLGWWFRWPVCYGPQVAKHFLGPHLVLQPIWGWGDLGPFQLPQSLCGYLQLLLLLLLFFFSSSSSLFSSSSKFPVGVSNQNFTDGVLKFYFFPSHCSRPSFICLV